MAFAPRRAADDAAGKAFRADLQALRALAVTLVVASHAQLAMLQGGFLGVDLFFVLSGYLITERILSQLRGSGSFSVGRFYARRMQRLLPGLVLMLAVTSFLAAHVLAPWRQLQQAFSMQAAAVWLSNLFFSARDFSYFSSGIDSYVWLHTWSLGVEEQFYLVWPWVLLFFTAYWSWQRPARGSSTARSNDSPRMRRLVVALCVLALASFALEVYWSRQSFAMAFYLAPARAWEFALGALTLAAREALQRSTHPASRQVLRASAPAGVALILLCAVFYTPRLNYPGLWAWIPCLGACLVALGSLDQAPGMFARVVNAKGVQFLGDVSYSWYLWHWPLLVLARQVWGTSWELRALTVALSLGVATASFVLVEQPLRRLRFRSSWKVLLGSALAAGLLVQGSSVWASNAAALEQKPEQAQLLEARLDVPTLYGGMNCDSWFYSDKVTVCRFGPRHATHKIVMLGDSVMAQWFPALYQIYVKDRHDQLLVLTKSSCAVQDTTYYYYAVHGPYTVCTTWRTRAFAVIQALHPDVIIAGSTDYDFSPRTWIDSTRRTLAELRKASSHVVLMAPPPRLGFDGLSCLAKHDVWPEWLPDVKACQSEENRAFLGAIDAWLRQAVAQEPGAQLLVLDQVVCPGGICRARQGSEVVFRDTTHVTASFARWATPQIEALLQAEHAIPPPSPPPSPGPARAG